VTQKALGMLVCVSHSPIIMIRAKAPAKESEILGLYAQCSADIKAFDPELVVIFGSDHFAGFHYSLMPPYCIGLAAAAVQDVGGFGGALDVPRTTALALVDGLASRGFDCAVSHDMRVDHAFSQPLHRLLGSIERYPVIPVFLNAIASPVLSFERAAQLGAAMGDILQGMGKRTLVIASGGLSHHPTRYYPLPGTATTEVEAWQMHGASGGSMTEDQWFSRLLDMHVEGAGMLVDGRRTVRDIRLNEQFDTNFMQMICDGDLGAARQWKSDWVIETAGIGAMEANAWVAGLSAYQRLDARPVHASLYVPALEYGIGYGMAVAGGI
jgi:2,3-dihydroxyphenylpropionate 1,2-dioxygenase